MGKIKAEWEGKEREFEFITDLNNLNDTTHWIHSNGDITTEASMSHQCFRLKIIPKRYNFGGVLYREGESTTVFKREEWYLSTSNIPVYCEVDQVLVVPHIKLHPVVDNV
jgi:hypothetical protein